MEDDGNGIQEEAGADQNCFLVWQGVAEKPQCSLFKSTFEVKREAEALKIFSERKLEHMWSTAVNFQASRALANVADD